jgi:hypothetical protein
VFFFVLFEEQDQLFNALVNPQVFNDERDAIIAKWNQLQAYYGTGKIFYQNSAADINKENQFNRFKVNTILGKPKDAFII